MRFHSAISSLYAEHYNLLGHDQATTCTLLYNASIIQDIKKKYIVIIYPFYDDLYEVNIHCFLLSIQITVVSALPCILPSHR